MPSVWRSVKTLPISAVSFPFSSSMMNRGPFQEVRASAFCVTPSPFRISRTSLPMSCGVYFIAFTSSIEVTVREYFSFFGSESQQYAPVREHICGLCNKTARMDPYGNKAYPPPCSGVRFMHQLTGQNPCQRRPNSYLRGISAALRILGTALLRSASSCLKDLGLAVVLNDQRSKHVAC